MRKLSRRSIFQILVGARKFTDSHVRRIASKMIGRLTIFFSPEDSSTKKSQSSSSGGLGGITGPYGRRWILEHLSSTLQRPCWRLIRTTAIRLIHKGEREYGPMNLLDAISS